MAYRTTTLSHAIVVVNGCVTIKKGELKITLLSVARAELKPLEIERFDWFTKTNVSNQAWKAWQTWLATACFFTQNKFCLFSGVIDISQWFSVQLRRLDTLIEEVETVIATCVWLQIIDFCSNFALCAIFRNLIQDPP